MKSDPIKALRIKNLTAFVKRNYDGNKSAAARDYGCEPQQMNDLIAGRKAFGEKVVRRCVEKMGVPLGYLDTPDADSIFFGDKAKGRTPDSRGKPQAARWPFSTPVYRWDRVLDQLSTNWERLTPGQKFKVEGDMALLIEGLEKLLVPDGLQQQSKEQEGRRELQRRSG